MLFFANPKRAKKSSSRRKSRRVRVRVRRVARGTSSKGASMARRKRSRARARTVSRRRRRSSTGRKSRRFAAVRAYLPNPRRRRRYRRNPSLLGGGGGIVNTLKKGVKDGLVVLGSQAVTKRGIGLAARFNPVQGLPGAAINGLGTAVIVTLAARKFAPRLAALISAAAFAEGLRGVIAQSPAAALFSGFETDNYAVGLEDGYGAWPAIPPSVQASGMGAWALGDADEQMMQ